LTARLLLAAAALCCGASLQAGEQFEKGVLWRVAKEGVAPSYVYGTMHVADPRLAELPAPVRKAFAGAHSLVVEYVADGYERARFLEAATFLDRQTLTEKIGRADFSRAQSLGVGGFPTLGIAHGPQLYLVTSGYVTDDVLEYRLAEIARLVAGKAAAA